jgi:hypothetical protein
MQCIDELAADITAAAHKFGSQDELESVQAHHVDKIFHDLAGLVSELSRITWLIEHHERYLEKD